MSLVVLVVGQAQDSAIDREKEVAIHIVDQMMTIVMMTMPRSVCCVGSTGCRPHCSVRFPVLSPPRCSCLKASPWRVYS